MPRIARYSLGGYCYHVMNRGNAPGTPFTDREDFATFLRSMNDAHVRLPMRVLGYCLLPDHFHLVLWPHHDGDLSRWMHCVSNTHVRRYHQRHKSSGHLWQGRFKAFPVAADEHLLNVLRFVESHALRSGLTCRAEEWAWSSLGWWVRGAETPSYAAVGPVPRGHDWPGWVNASASLQENARIVASMRRSQPLGDEAWVQETAVRMGLEPTLRPRGRPRVRPLADGTKTE